MIVGPSNTVFHPSNNPSNAASNNPSNPSNVIFTLKRRGYNAYGGTTKKDSSFILTNSDPDIRSWRKGMHGWVLFVHDLVILFLISRYVKKRIFNIPLH